MGRIVDPILKSLSDQWSPLIRRLLDDLGTQAWGTAKKRRGLFKKAESIKRHFVEGPEVWSGKLCWAVSHTSTPSTFDEYGDLSEGKREYWIVRLSVNGDSPTFMIEGKEKIDGIALDSSALYSAFEQAGKSGPQPDNFYGNKGPLTHV